MDNIVITDADHDVLVNVSLLNVKSAYIDYVREAIPYEDKGMVRYTKGKFTHAYINVYYNNGAQTSVMTVHKEEADAFSKWVHSTYMYNTTFKEKNNVKQWIINTKDRWVKHVVEKYYYGIGAVLEVLDDNDNIVEKHLLGTEEETGDLQFYIQQNKDQIKIIGIKTGYFL